jgi:hypothetical protein
MIYSGGPREFLLNYYRKVVKSSTKSSKFLDAENLCFTDSTNTKLPPTPNLLFPLYTCTCNKRGIFMEFPIHKVVIVVIVYCHYLLKVLKKSIYHLFYYHNFFSNLIQKRSITESAPNKWDFSDILLFYYFDTKVSKIRQGVGCY